MKMKTKETILKRAGSRNDCVGFCIYCPQAKDELLQPSEKERVIAYVCELPPLHSVTFGKRRS